MSSLSSLQIKIRDIETAVDGILKSLNSVRDDMAELGGLSGAAAAVDFRKISAEAKHVKFGPHPIKKASRKEAEAYIDILLDILKLDDSAAEEKLIFIGSILSRSGYDRISLEERAVNVYTTERNEYLELYDKIPSGLRTVLLTDALITAHIGGSANDECARYLASLFDVFEIKDSDIKTYTSFAKAVLTRRNNMTAEDAANAEKLGNVRCYLSDEWQGYTKGLVVLVRLDTGREVTWFPNKGDKVRKGYTIAVINGQKVKTPMNGRFWRFFKNQEKTGVVAPEIFDEPKVREILFGEKIPQSGMNGGVSIGLFRFNRNHNIN